MKIFFSILAKASILAFLSTNLMASGSADTKSAKDIDFSFEGPFGKFDKAQLQRGFQVYSEVCSACHSLNYVSYRELSEPDGPAFSADEVKAIAAQKEVTDGPNVNGEMFQRPALPSDKFVAPFSNKEAAIAANGAYPPDLSLITKSRAGWHGTFNQLFYGLGGPEYVYSVLTGYQEAPKGMQGPEGKSYNPYFIAGTWISMSAPLSNGSISYSDGTEATVDQMAKDVSAFLAWTAEPRMVERKSIGFIVMISLFILSVLLYFSYKTLWRNIK